MNVFEIKGVYKSYLNAKNTQARIALRNINLNIRENEFVCIIGPSGCGKTTLLNLMAGFEEPLKGEVLFKGGPVDGAGPDRGVVFQEYSLMPWTNVLKNVEFGIDRKKYDKEKRVEIARHFIDMVGLSEFINHRPNLLSGGMKQRVAIARVLAMGAEVLLMDEPFSNLDEQTRKHLDGEIKKIWRDEKKTVVFITHSIEEALLLGTRIIMLSSAPGMIIGEWIIDVDERNLSSDAFSRLKEEISQTLSKPKEKTDR